MDTPSAVAVLAALAHVGRLDLFRLLVRRLPGRVTPAEIIETLELGPSVVSAHLRVLGQVRIVSHVRQGRSLKYRAEMGALDSLTRFLVEDCCRGRTVSGAEDGAGCCSLMRMDVKGDRRRRLNVLFLDRGDAVRALAAQAVLMARHPDTCCAFSAGTARVRRPRRAVLDSLRSAGYDASDLRPSPVRKLRATDAPAMDVVVTLSPEAASPAERCWQGRPVTSHWDAPMLENGLVEADHVAGFVRDLERRIDAFAGALDEASDRGALQRAVDDAGTIGDAPGRSK